MTTQSPARAPVTDDEATAGVDLRVVAACATDTTPPMARTARAAASPLARQMTHPILSRSQEKRLFQRIEEGDRRAFDQAVACNMRLVAQIAQRYTRVATTLDLEDLIQEGVIGLMRAIEKFDWRRGYKFSTYATAWVQQAVQRAIANTDAAIRIPVSVCGEVRRLQMTEGAAPDACAEEIARRMSSSVERVQELRGLARVSTSLDRRVERDGGEGATLGEFLYDESARGLEDVVEGTIAAAAVAEAVARLDARSRRIVSLRFGLGDEGPQGVGLIARRLGVSVGEVRRWEHRAIETLRALMGTPPARTLAGSRAVAETR